MCKEATNRLRGRYSLFFSSLQEVVDRYLRFKEKKEDFLKYMNLIGFPATDAHITSFLSVAEEEKSENIVLVVYTEKEKYYMWLVGGSSISPYLREDLIKVLSGALPVPEEFRADIMLFVKAHQII